MHRNETVEDLKLQIEQLQKRLGELNAGGGDPMHHQVGNFACEMEDIHKAAAKLKSIRNELCGAKCASEVAKSLGVLWLGSVITYWLKTSLKLGHKVSGVMLLVTAVSAALPLGVNGCCRLRKVLLENPKAVDDLLLALAALDNRINIMMDRTSQLPSSGPGCAERFAPGNVRGPASPITDISTGAPGRTGDETAAASPLGSGSDDMVHVVPSDWESPTRSQHYSRITFHQPTGSRAPTANSVGESSLHVSTADIAEGAEAVLDIDKEKASDHVMVADSK